MSDYWVGAFGYGFGVIIGLIIHSKYPTELNSSLYAGAAIMFFGLILKFTKIGGNK